MEARLEELALETGIEADRPAPPVRQRRLPLRRMTATGSRSISATCPNDQVRALLTRLVGDPRRLKPHPWLAAASAMIQLRKALVIGRSAVSRLVIR